MNDVFSPHLSSSITFALNHAREVLQIEAISRFKGISPKKTAFGVDSSPRKIYFHYHSQALFRRTAEMKMRKKLNFF